LLDDHVKTKHFSDRAVVGKKAFQSSTETRAVGSKTGCIHLQSASSTRLLSKVISITSLELRLGPRVSSSVPLDNDVGDVVARRDTSLDISSLKEVREETADKGVAWK
jgi:hypothetical protein